MPNSKDIQSHVISSGFLAGLPIFQGMSETEVLLFLSSTQGYYASFEKGEFIGMEGDLIPGVGVLLSGRAVVLKENAAGERHRVAILKPGDIFGEVAVYTGDHWTASVLAEDSSSVLVLPKKNLMVRKKHDEASELFQLNMLKLVSRKALKLNQNLEILSMRTLRQKLIRLFQMEWKMQKQNPLKLSMNREEMAEFLQVSRPALSRELMKMKVDNLIDYRKNEFYLFDWTSEME